ncbi:MAG TPA: Flp pilus assembly protein CpaB [Stellaceae bacterium]|nr:Flp pilus assembly protein CpaB [Stellaceae bacterium]
MQASRAVLLAGAIGFAVCGALVVRAWVANVRASVAVPAPVAMAPPPKAETRVLVASRALAVGHVVRADDLRWQGWPAGDVIPGSLVEGTDREDKLVGALLREPVQEGVPVTPSQVVFRGDHGVLAALLRPGYRAVTVALTGNVGLSGLVVPGDHVDVIVSMAVNRAADKSQRRLSQTVLRDVRVIAVDQNVGSPKPASDARTATLEVTAKQAEMLVLVVDMGKVSLSLRSLADDSAAETGQSITWDSDTSAALARSDARPAALPEERIGIVRGTKPSEVEFAGGEP